MTTSSQRGLPEGVQEQLQKELEAERAKLLRQVDGLAAEADITHWPQARINGDPADAGVAQVARDRARLLSGHAHRMLVAVEDALDRINHGTYGTCASCDDPIAQARLQALPHATLCIDCQQHQEHAR